MKITMSLCLFACFLIATGNSWAEQNDGNGKNAMHGLHAVKPETPLPPNHPAMTGMMPHNSQQPSMRAPEGPVQKGKVLEVANGAGYSYLKLDSGGKPYWIAGMELKVHKGDIVNYINNVEMNKFYSKTLNKTFDRIIFASSVEVVK